MNVWPPSQGLTVYKDNSPWRWRQYAPPKCWQLFPSQHGITSPMIWLFNNTAVTVSDLAYWCLSSKLLGITSHRTV